MCCTAERGQKLESPTPTRRQLAGRARALETWSPSQAPLRPLLSDRRAEWHALTANPPSTNATMGVRYGISLAVHPLKWWSSDPMSSTKTVPQGWAISSGNLNAGPETTLPLTSDIYRSACKGSSRKSDTGGSCRAKQSSSSATSCGTPALTAQAQLSFPRMR